MGWFGLEGLPGPGAQGSICRSENPPRCWLGVLGFCLEHGATPLGLEAAAVLSNASPYLASRDRVLLTHSAILFLCFLVGNWSEDL